MSISQHIFSLLEIKGKTAKELSKFIGVSESSISAWKNEGSFPSSKYIISISEFLDVPIEYLFTGKIPAQDNMPLNYLTEDESELIEVYQRLDSRGQHRLHTVGYEELERMEEAHKKAKEKDAHAG